MKKGPEKPAAGPETLIFEVLKNPMTIPPTIPEITPESGGAPDARAIPKHSGSATRKTTNPEAKFDLKRAPKGCFSID